MNQRKTKQIRVSREVHSLLRRQAFEHGVTISHLANHVISRIFGNDNPEYEISDESISDAIPVISYT